MKKYYSTHYTCTKYIQSANRSCDELIKSAYHQKKLGSYLPTYLGLPTYLTRWLISKPNLVA